jgi:glycosyltransferase involved in cell wall biosynthesis
MNILYAVHAYKPAYRIGGPVISVSAAAEMLVRKGHHVTVFTTNSNLDQPLDVAVDRPVDVNGVEVWYFRREEPLQKWVPFLTYLTRSIGFMYCPAMRGELERVMPRIDLVDTHMPFTYPSYAAAHAAFRAGVPLVYHQRGNYDPARLRFRGTKKRAYISLVERPIMSRASRLIALTEAERASFRAVGATAPCEVVPNGVDIPDDRPGAAERFRQRWGVDPAAPLVLFMGRLHPTKGAEKLLDAFALVEERLPDAVVMMAGPDEWQLERRWRERAARSGLADRVLFPGMLTGDEKADALARADLFSLPSMGEGFSMAVLEALAARTAVLLSPGCHFPEVDSAGAGAVVDADPAAMAAALLRLLSDRGKLAEMGEKGRRLVAERYSWEAVTDRLLEVYESARGERRA